MSLPLIDTPRKILSRLYDHLDPVKVHQNQNGECPMNGNVANGKVGNGKAANGNVGDGVPGKRLFPVEFEWIGPGENVHITGSFYNWSVKIPLSKKSNKFYAKIDLPKGHHEFKFVVNGAWRCSFHYPTISNTYGDLNNYVDV